MKYIILLVLIATSPLIYTLYLAHINNEILQIQVEDRQTYRRSKISSIMSKPYITDQLRDIHSEFANDGYINRFEFQYIVHFSEELRDDYTY
jgi:hypothetical protein